MRSVDVLLFAQYGITNERQGALDDVKALQLQCDIRQGPSDNTLRPRLRTLFIH